MVVSNRGCALLPYPLRRVPDRTDGSMRIGDSLFTPYASQLRIDEPDFELVGRPATITAAAALGHHAVRHVPTETKHTVFSMRTR